MAGTIWAPNDILWLAKHFGIEQPKAHDAYYDALTCAEIYRRLVQYDVLL